MACGLLRRDLAVHILRGLGLGLIVCCVITRQLRAAQCDRIAMDTELRVGGRSVDRLQARDLARRYLSGSGAFGYPAYDAFDAGAGPWRLSDGDLLAPALLNVTVRVPAFYALTDVRPRLELWLTQVPPDLKLTEAGPPGVPLLAELFALIDQGLPGVGGTTLAKIMHRKRPAFVPLYDRYVHECYVGAHGFPVPRARSRTWREFIHLLGPAMVDDLQRENAWMAEVAQLAAGPVPVTTLRVLDIVAWQAGRQAYFAGDPSNPDVDVEGSGDEMV